MSPPICCFFHSRPGRITSFGLFVNESSGGLLTDSSFNVSILFERTESLYVPSTPLKTLTNNIVSVARGLGTTCQNKRYAEACVSSHSSLGSECYRYSRFVAIKTCRTFRSYPKTFRSPTLPPFDHSRRFFFWENKKEPVGS